MRESRSLTRPVPRAPRAIAVLAAALLCACALAAALPAKALAASASLPTVGNNLLYANGTALVIAADGGGTTVYVDENRNGTVDAGEKSLADHGIAGAPADGADLSGWLIFGGSFQGDIAADSKITMTGGKVNWIFGGCDTSLTLTGSISITVAGGEVASVFASGMGSGANVTGSASVAVAGGTVGQIKGSGAGGIVAGGVSVAVTGGAVTGSIDTCAAVTVGGAAKVGGDNPYTGIYINGGSSDRANNGVDSFAIGEDLTGDAAVYVNLPEGYDASAEPEVATGATAGDAARLRLTGLGAAGKELYFDDAAGAVKVRNVAPHSHCVCGGNVVAGDHTTHTDNIDYQPLPAGYAGGELKSGSYYLAGDVELTQSVKIPEGVTVSLCLNGHKLDAAGRGFPVIETGWNSTLNLSDCREGKLAAPYEIDDPTDEGGATILVNSGMVTGGTASGVKGGGGVSSNGAFNLYSGAVASNEAAEGDRGGGGVSNEAFGIVLTMYGGSVVGNAAAGYGGGIGAYPMGGDIFVHGGTVANNAAAREGGGVMVIQSRFTMTGGSIAGNAAAGDGGGVANSSPFDFSGGSITGNEAGGVGGGINVGPAAKTSLSGAVTVTGNTAGGEASNVEVSPRDPLTIAGVLDPASSIGISMDTPGVFTTGTTVDNALYAANFASDRDDYVVAATDGKQLELRAAYPVTVTGGTADKARAAEGEEVTVTAGAAPAGRRFKEWSFEPEVTFAGGTSAASPVAIFAMPAGAVAAEAVYEDVPAEAIDIASAEPTASSVEVRWNLLAGVSAYTVLCGDLEFPGLAPSGNGGADPADAEHYSVSDGVASYSIGNLEPGTAYEVQVVAPDGRASGKVAVATLGPVLKSVEAAPALSEKRAGETVVLTATALGAAASGEARAFQWQKEAGHGSGQWADVPGATSAALTVTAEAGEAEAHYRCVVTALKDDVTVEHASNEAVVRTVADPVGPVDPVDPTDPADPADPADPTDPKPLPTPGEGSGSGSGDGQGGSGSAKHLAATGDGALPAASLAAAALASAAALAACRARRRDG